MIKIGGVIALLFVWILQLQAQPNTNMGNSSFTNIDQALKAPQEYSSLMLDCTTGDCDKIFENIQKFTQLTRVFISGVNNNNDLHSYIAQLVLDNRVTDLTIANSNLRKTPQSLSNLKKLERLTLSNCPEISLKTMFRQLASTASFTGLTIDNCQVEDLPKEIRMLLNLTRLYITNNEGLDLERTINEANKLPSLLALGLPINQITDLPDNIGILTTLELLDIRNNNLTDLPGAMAGMEQLSKLKLEGNILINPVSSLEKVKTLNLKYLSVDEDLTEGERKKLQTLFPDAEIKEMDYEQSMNELAEEQMITNESTPKENNVQVGSFTVKGDDFKVLSTAYLHYPELFDSEKFDYKFDSLLFEERYRDTTYCNTWKIQPNTNYDKIALHLFKKGEKNEIWFDFTRYAGWPIRNNKYNKYLNNNHREVNAFIPLVWVYTGDLSKKEFTQRYIKNKQWTDLRIFYNQSAKNFTIELKHLRGFERLIAYPRSANIDVALEEAQKTYEKRFVRYTRTLASREKSFHKQLLKDKYNYDKTIATTHQKAWEDFRRMYMSEEEQEMTQEEWLMYYDKVVANEKKALYNADACIDNFVRSLTKDGYKRNDHKLHESIARGNAKSINSFFHDLQSNQLAVKEIMVINYNDRSFHLYKGSLGVKPVRLFLQNSPHKAIVVEIRNGDMAIITKNDYAKIDFSSLQEVNFEMKRFKRSLSTIGLLRDKLGL